MTPAKIDGILRCHGFTGVYFEFNAAALGRALVWTIAALVAAFILTRIGIFCFGVFPERRILTLLDLGCEHNVPSLFSGLLIALGGLLAAAAAKGERKNGRPFWAWAGLAVLLLFLAADEWLAFHEHLIKPLQKALNTRGPLLFAWVIPYGALTACFVAVYARFLSRLPRVTSRLFIAAGGVYVAGAMGCELLGGLIQESLGRDSIAFAAEVLVEETLEMSGMALFVYALAAHLERTFPAIGVRMRAS